MLNSLIVSEDDTVFLPWRWGQEHWRKSITGWCSVGLKCWDIWIPFHLIWIILAHMNIVLHTICNWAKLSDYGKEKLLEQKLSGLWRWFPFKGEITWMWSMQIWEITTTPCFIRYFTVLNFDKCTHGRFWIFMLSDLHASVYFWMLALHTWLLTSFVRH
jgi:hypothetical protein